MLKYLVIIEKSETGLEVPNPTIESEMLVFAA